MEPRAILKTINGVTFTVEYEGSYARESLEITAVRLGGYGQDLLDFLSDSTIGELRAAMYEEERK